VLQASLAEQYANEEADLNSQTADVAALAAELAALLFSTHMCAFFVCPFVLQASLAEQYAVPAWCVV
jgi:hypothetical protein